MAFCKNDKKKIIHFICKGLYINKYYAKNKNSMGIYKE